MINLELVQKLEDKVKNAIEFISLLREENEKLESRITELESQLSELNQVASSHEADQEKLDEEVNIIIDMLDKSVKNSNPAIKDSSSEDQEVNNELKSEDEISDLDKNDNQSDPDQDSFLDDDENDEDKSTSEFDIF